MTQESHNSTQKSPAQGEKPSTPLHYRLTNEECLTVFKDLKPAEIFVLYYLRTLDPFGDRTLNLKVIDIAEATGLRKGTVSKALKVLSEKDYIDLEMIVVQIRVKKFPTEGEVSYRKPNCTPGNFDARQETLKHARKPDCTPGNFQDSERALAADSEIPHTLHTDQTSQTLSHAHPPTEREVLNFVIGEIKKDNTIRQPRAYAKRAIEKDREFWIEKFQKWQEESERIEQIKCSGAPTPSNDFVAPNLEEIRDRYLSMWNTLTLRGHITQRIAAQPELGLEIIGEELRRIEHELPS